MSVIDVTIAEKDIADLGYDPGFPTRQQENLASIYVRHLYEANGKTVYIENGDVTTAVSQAEEVFQAANLPVQYAPFISDVVSAALAVLSFTATKGDIIRDIGINAIDQIIHHALRIIFDKFFSDDAPGDVVTPSVEEIVAQLEKLVYVQGTQDLKIYDDARGTLISITGGEVSLESNP